MSIQVLLVEDDTELAGSLADYLSEVGFEVDFAFHGQACLELMQHNRYEIIIMDVSMPNMDGLETCRMLRQQNGRQIPIIFLTARDSLDDKLAGFAAGGDDYLVKPFAAPELAARLRALHERGSNQTSSIVQIGPLRLQHQLKRVERQGQHIELHDLQFRLLNILANHAPQPVARKTLEQQLWPNGSPDSDALRTHVYRLRNALDKPYQSELIRTVHGKGYRLAIPD